ncbi:hypothetical protein FACS1894170_11080 [Planctomycetales bacterium]|nr:hypothetical protein FACS1894170_11080 [Planctomycetales bacterium]
MSSEIIIANPIYDVVFKRLMEDTKNARFFIKTLLNQDVEEIQFKPQEYTLSDTHKKRLSGQDVQMPGALTVLRLDFVATIKNADGTRQKVLIEVQKGKRNLDVMRFRDYLAEHYKREDEIVLPDGDVQQTPLHIIAIYIVAFDLPHIKTPAAKVGREYIDLLTHKKIKEKEDFVEQLTHDCIIIQTGRIHGSIKTELDALLSIFEQRYFADEKGHFKEYQLPIKSAEMRHLTKTLIGIAASPEGRRQIDAEEAVRRLVEGDGDVRMQKIRRELKKKDKALAEKEKALAEKDKALTENKKALAEQAKQIAELKAKLSSRKSK